MLDVGCFNVVDEKNGPKGRKGVRSWWLYMSKGDVNGNCLEWLQNKLFKFRM